MTNEKNEPVAAALGVSSRWTRKSLALGRRSRPHPHAILSLASEIVRIREDLENADFYLSQNKSATVPPAVALDLLLGTRQASDNSVDNAQA